MGRETDGGSEGKEESGLRALLAEALLGSRSGIACVRAHCVSPAAYGSAFKKAVALTAPRSLLGFTFRIRAAACARESATALPWAHCSAFRQDVPREVNPIVHGREKTIRLIMRQALAAML